MIAVHATNDQDRNRDRVIHLGPLHTADVDALDRASLQRWVAVDGGRDTQRVSRFLDKLIEQVVQQWVIPQGVRIQKLLGLIWGKA